MGHYLSMTLVRMGRYAHLTATGNLPAILTSHVAEMAGTSVDTDPQKPIHDDQRCQLGPLARFDLIILQRSWS